MFSRRPTAGCNWPSDREIAGFKDDGPCKLAIGVNSSDTIVGAIRNADKDATAVADRWRPLQGSAHLTDPPRPLPSGHMNGAGGSESRRVSEHVRTRGRQHDIAPERRHLHLAQVETEPVAAGSAVRWGRQLERG